MPRVRRPSAAVATALALCAGSVLTLGAAAPSGAAPADARAAGRTAEPSLTGAGKLQRRPGDDVHFAFDAHGFADQANGTFSVSHHMDKKWGGHFRGRIDCLLTGGPVAVATGVVTEVDFTGAPGYPELGDIKGKRFGFTVLDDGRKDRLGYSWALDGLPRNSVGKCQSSAPFETLEKGDFQVRHWLPPRPAARG
ncbi:hypothetical protein ADK76_09040 [Streptomyces griseoflavus]|uniref:hypothetical protein n=1 Tax=Streptomyces rimosus TaxID=1927 RepID=UPI0004CA16BD|nr:hypothetical protein [Streptomyces rimosus]KOG64576.1 hypothetical protein ADK76_09040 [Streptomyces griseoflavus]